MPCRPPQRGNSAALLCLYSDSTPQVITPLLALACYRGPGFCATLKPTDISPSPQHMYSVCAKVHAPDKGCDLYLCWVHRGVPSSEKELKWQQLPQVSVGHCSSSAVPQAAERFMDYLAKGRSPWQHLLG